VKPVEVARAVAEPERSLIVERVRDGVANVGARGKGSGRPRVALDPAQIARLRTQGHPWPQTGRQLGVSVGTAHKTVQGGRPRNDSVVAAANG
jgi:DNA invertase Pin-like site-specific DNA recombinase